MQKFREQAERFGTDAHREGRHQGRLQPAPVPHLGQRRRVPRRCGDRRHRRIGPLAGPAHRGGVPRPRRERLRHLRRVLLPRPRGRRRRRRRHRARGGDVPHPLRRQGHHARAARRVPRQSKIMQDRALNHEKIDVLWNKEVAEVKGEMTVNALTLRDTTTGETSELAVQGLFVAIGYKPNTDLFAGQLTVGRGRVPRDRGWRDGLGDRRGLRGRRRPRPPLPAGGHRRRRRLQGRHRRRALARVGRRDRGLDRHELVARRTCDPAPARVLIPRWRCVAAGDECAPTAIPGGPMCGTRHTAWLQAT